MNRNAVYDLIDGERDYQDRRWADSGGRPKSDSETPVSSWLLYIETQLNRAKDSIYNLDEQGALEYVRKIAGLAVACMENNETKPRQLFLS